MTGETYTAFWSGEENACEVEVILADGPDCENNGSWMVEDDRGVQSYVCAEHKDLMKQEGIL